jgi:hypothetical protein
MVLGAENPGTEAGLSLSSQALRDEGSHRELEKREMTQRFFCQVDRTFQVVDMQG